MISARSIATRIFAVVIVLSLLNPVVLATGELNNVVYNLLGGKVACL